jgi:sugar/nucleoside kinase (ribokinase family)
MIYSGKFAVVKALERMNIQKSNSVIDNPQFMTDIRLMGSALLSHMIRADTSKPRPTQTRITGKHVIISLGKDGVLWLGPVEVIGKGADSQIDDLIACKHIPVTLIENIVNTSGAGDSFCAGLIHGLMPGKGSGPSIESIKMGIRYASYSLQSSTAVPLDITMEKIEGK